MQSKGIKIEAILRLLFDEKIILQTSEIYDKVRKYADFSVSNRIISIQLVKLVKEGFLKREICLNDTRSFNYTRKL